MATVTDNNDYIFKYELNEPLTKQYGLVLSNWCRMEKQHNGNVDIPTDVNKLIMVYSQYASFFNKLEIIIDETIDGTSNTSSITKKKIKRTNADTLTFKTVEPFPLNKGKYSFTATIKATNADDDKIMNGDTLESLHFIGICSDRFTEFDRYVLYSNKKDIYGFGDDIIARGWVTWRYFGDGSEPRGWYECKGVSGGFGHNDRITIVVDMDKGWIRGYKNGKRFVNNDIGDINVKFDDNTKFCPAFSTTNIVVFV